MAEIRPFKINVPQEKLDRLKQKLAMADFPDEIENAGWRTGTPLKEVQNLVKYWRDDFDWRAAEAALNADFPAQYMTKIDVDGFGSLDVHFVHLKSGVPSATPMIMVHGWPGSFLETRKVLPLLTKESPDGPVFDLDPPKFKSNPIYWLQHKLSSYTEEEKRGIERIRWFRGEAEGYYFVQCNRPQTLGYALADSPVALLAWILEKLNDWTDSYPWTRDEILTWVSIYLFSRSGPAASVRIYFHANYESNREDLVVAKDGYVDVPTGVSLFPLDINVPPRSWPLAQMGKIVFEARHNDGGHFAAYERPEVLVDDIRKMFGKGSKAFGLVPEKSGYRDGSS